MILDSNVLTTDPILSRLLDQVCCAGPEDDSQLIAADRAEEIGEDAIAECLRWMHAERKWPKKHFGRTPWTWWGWEDSAIEGRTSCLPHIRGIWANEAFSGAWCWHPTSALAVEALLNDWKRLRETYKGDLR